MKTSSLIQPLPHPGKKEVIPVARKVFNIISESQEKKGITKYNRPLETWNGRDAFVDSLQDMVDSIHYIVQAKLEYNDLQDDISKLTEKCNDLEERIHILQDSIKEKEEEIVKTKTELKKSNDFIKDILIAYQEQKPVDKIASEYKDWLKHEEDRCS